MKTIQNMILLAAMLVTGLAAAANPPYSPQPLDVSYGFCGDYELMMRWTPSPAPAGGWVTTITRQWLRRASDHQEFSLSVTATGSKTLYSERLDTTGVRMVLATFIPVRGLLPYQEHVYYLVGDPTEAPLAKGLCVDPKSLRQR